MKAYTPQLNSISVEQTTRALALDPSGVVREAEVAFARQLEEVANWAVFHKRQVILLAGPSASGKTTTAKKLTRNLIARGKKAHYISLDNFYKGSGCLPLWPDGSVNFETIEGLDLELFHTLFRQLAEEGYARFPVFDFAVNQRGTKTFEVTYDSDTYLVIEGIHALNPLLTKAADEETLRVYVSVHSDFVGPTGEVLLEARQLRLARRIIRDRVRRESSAQDTLEMWDNVARGEELYIRPYRGQAHIHLDSTHAFEPYLYHDTVIDALTSCHIAPEFLPRANRMMATTASFSQMDSSLIPGNSLVQEFIML